MTQFFYVESISKATHEIKKSKFISYLFPFNKFHEKMEQIKKEHPKARHFVYAYRHFNEFGQINENMSDDGEPRGSSGKPSLSVIRGASLINCGLITVRYFGGVKLGVGGLVRAYSQAANMVIKESPLIPYEELLITTCEVIYSNLEKLKYRIKKQNGSVISTTYEGNHVIIKIKMNQDNTDYFISHLKETRLAIIK